MKMKEGGNYEINYLKQSWGESSSARRYRYTRRVYCSTPEVRSTVTRMRK